MRTRSRPFVAPWRPWPRSYQNWKPSGGPDASAGSHHPPPAARGTGPNRGPCDMTLYDGEGAMARDQLLTEVADKAGAIPLPTDRVDDEFLDAAAPPLKIVANYAVGFDNIDVDACTRHGVLTSNTPEVLTETTADAAFALMMAAARRVAEGDRFLRSRTPWIWGPLMMLGQDVHHKDPRHRGLRPNRAGPGPPCPRVRHARPLSRHLPATR